MDLKQLKILRKLALIAIFTDDQLMEHLVLKGGNALDLIYDISSRGSSDLDFSMDGEFSEDECDEIQAKVQRLLENTLRPEGYIPFDVRFAERPRSLSKDMAPFWGGYRIEFKVIAVSKHEAMRGNLERLRRHATILDERQRKKFQIDISKFEYCKKKRDFDLDGYTVYVYTPEMILLEKVRAICQQMAEYREIATNASQSARARDFFDIYTICQKYEIALTEHDNIDLLEAIFGAKRVPIGLIRLIPQYREYHRPDFEAVKATVAPNVQLEEFDFYFDYVLKKLSVLEPLWKE